MNSDYNFINNYSNQSQLPNSYTQNQQSQNNINNNNSLFYNNNNNNNNNNINNNLNNNNNNNNNNYYDSINLENMDYKNHNMIIDSPRSIYICRSHGIEMEDLYYYNFFEYRNMHPEIIPLNLDIQKSHFYHDQGIREITLSKLIRERRDLIKQE